MSDSRIEPDPAPDDIELLLPWYETGTLSRDDRRRVEAFLSAHPEYQTQTSLISEEVDLVRAANEELPTPSRDALNNLMAEIEAESPTRQDEFAGEGAAARWLARIFPGGVFALRAGLAACAFLIAVQVGALFYVSQDETSGFQTASNSEEVMSGAPDVLITFQVGASMDDVGALLSSIDATLVDGPKAGGVYGLRLAEGADKEAALSTLQEASDLVSFAAPAGG